MTVSFIHFYIKPDSTASLTKSLRLVMVLFVMLCLTTTVDAEGEILIKSANLNIVNDDYQLNVDSTIVLNPTLEQALEKGVVLYFVTRFGLAQPRWYWVNEEVARSKLRVGLSYYALTRQYRLSHGAWSQSFATLQEALRVLGRVRNRPVILQSELKQNIDYVATLRVWLDLERLPKPFQIQTIGSKAWHLTSRRLTWRTELPLSTWQLYQPGDL